MNRMRYAQHNKAPAGPENGNGGEVEPLAPVSQSVPVGLRLGGLKELKSAMGGKVGITYLSALKKAAGVGSVRLFDIDAVIAWKKQNPRFKITDVCPRRQNGALERA